MQLGLVWSFDDDRHRAKLSLLLCRVVRLDSSGDNHRSIAMQIDGRGSHPHIRRELRRLLNALVGRLLSRKLLDLDVSILDLGGFDFECDFSTCYRC